MVRDLEEIPEHSVEARMLAGQIVVDALNFRNLWAHTRPAALLARARNEDASLASQVEGFYDSGSPRDAIAITNSVLEMVGGRISEFVTPAQPA